MPRRVEGKVALVSGAARGQGAAHARLLASEGAAVVLGDVLDDLGEETAAAIRADGHRARYVHHDVTSVADWDAAVALAEREFGKLDVLVNNAGIVLYAAAEDCSDEEWAKVIAVNQTGVFYGMRAAIPALRRAGGGSIISTSSLFGGVRGARAYVAYASSKAAVVAMTQSVALSYGPDNIRANAIAPGATNTAQLEQEIEFFGVEKIDRGVEAQPIKRRAEPLEMAQAVLFLASDESAYITGITLAIDGGRTI